MPFLTPSPPPFDLEEWKRQPFLTRLKANAQDWAVNGFGTPGVVYVLYIVKLAIYLVGGFVVIGATTPGLGGLGDFGDWWSQPIVFQKFAVWTLVWEMLGLGSGSMMLALRFSPPIGGVLYWLRPGTVRLAPWPDKVPMTRGFRRTALRRRAVRRRAGGRRLPDRLRRRPGGLQARHGLDRRAARPARGARAARQGPLPRGAPRDLRLRAARLAVPGGEPDPGLAVRLLLHLVGRRRLEAQPPLPVRDPGDDLEHALEPVAEVQVEDVPRLSRATCGRPDRPR